jgi:hypothetical protein
LEIEIRTDLLNFEILITHLSATDIKRVTARDPRDGKAAAKAIRPKLDIAMTKYSHGALYSKIGDVDQWKYMSEENRSCRNWERMITVPVIKSKITPSFECYSSYMGLHSPPTNGHKYFNFTQRSWNLSLSNPCMNKLLSKKVA